MDILATSLVAPFEFSGMTDLRSRGIGAPGIPRNTEGYVAPDAVECRQCFAVLDVRLAQELREFRKTADRVQPRITCHRRVAAEPPADKRSNSLTAASLSSRCARWRTK